MEQYARVAVAFNGGKESVVVSHMWLGKDVTWVCAEEENPFPELAAYRKDLANQWGIEVRYLQGGMRKCVQQLHDEGVEAVVMGTRSSDPHAPSSTHSPTTRGWAPMIRVNPILDWSYAQVWDYIEQHKLPVCPLYAQGYTSIGTLGKTFPNHSLWSPQGWQHARTLFDQSTERVGRITNALPIKFESRVIHGKGLGKTLGYPTANCNVTFDLDHGVYCGTVVLRGIEYLHISSFGCNTTFDETKPIFECHILSDLDDFYGEIIYVILNHFIRPMLTFDSEVDLIEAMSRDKRIAQYMISKL